MNHVTHVQFWLRNGAMPASVDIERRHRNRSYDRVTGASARRLAAVCRFQLLTGEFRASIYANGHQLRSGIADSQLAELVVLLREENRLSLRGDDGDGDEPETEPRIVCSLGLR